MNCVITINGREAVPVRAIPFITGWRTFSPDAVAMGLAQRCDWGRLGGLTAYHVAEDGSTHEVLPKEWDGVASELAALSKRLKKDDPDAAVSYPEWREKSISCLPSHCFVWLDEFERVYKRAMDWLHIVNERAGDKQLNYNPRIPAAAITAVFEGLPRASTTPFKAATPECMTPLAEQQDAVAASFSKSPQDDHPNSLLHLIPDVIAFASKSGHWPKQDQFIGDLEEKFGITKSEARALDAVTRPDKQRGKKPLAQGRKSRTGAGLRQTQG